jgi:secondary thiamine-phosphate synthase enzyme
MIEQQTLRIATRGRGLTEITRQVAQAVSNSGVQTGLCNVFIQHTSASLIISENADPEVGRDLERFFARIAPDGDRLFEHDAEGPDDMPAHIRTILTNTSLVIPIAEGRLLLGTWQGIFLWEHRHAAHERTIIVSVCG